MGFQAGLVNPEGREQLQRAAHETPTPEPATQETLKVPGGPLMNLYKEVRPAR